MAPHRRKPTNYYAVLGVPPEATEDEIRRAYRRLALQWHPDRNPGDPTAADRFKEISAAYAVLVDPAKRRDHDRAQQSGAPGPFDERRDDLFRDLFADPRASAIFEDLARELQRMGLRVDRHDFQSTLFGGRTVVTGRVVVVSPFTSPVGLFRLARAVFGIARAVRGGRRAEAEVAMPAPPPSVGERVARAGRWLFGLPPASTAPVGTADVVIPLTLTPDEARQGGAKRVTLRRNGTVEDVIVKVPPGTRDGTRLRLRGKGAVAPGRAAGDAYLTVEIR